METENLTGLTKIAAKNNLGVQVTSILFHGVSSIKIEKAIMNWLVSKGIDTTNLSCRVIPKSLCSKNPALAKIAAKTEMPFIAVLFNSLSKDNFSRKNNMDEDAAANIRAALFNFNDNAQITLKNDQELNKVLAKVVYRDRITGEIHWGINKKAKKAYIALIPSVVFLMSFDIPIDDANKYVVDFIDAPIVRTDRNTFMTETVMNVAISLKQPKKRPQHDPINDIR